MSTESTQERQTKFAAVLVLSKNLKWEETADPKTFQAKLNNFVVQVAKAFDEFALEDYIRIVLYNADGKLMDDIAPGRIDSDLFNTLTKQYVDGALEALYERARRYALGADDALDKATMELARYLIEPTT